MKVRKFTCKDCRKPAWMTLKNKEEIKEFNRWTKGFSCDFCAYKFWKESIASGETNLAENDKEFQELYRQAEKKYE